MFLKAVTTALALSVGAITYTSPAQANANDAVIAGAAGFAVGTVVGSAAYPGYAPRAYYRPYYHPRVYYAPRRAYLRPYRGYYRHPAYFYGSGYPIHRCINRDNCY